MSLYKGETLISEMIITSDISPDEYLGDASPSDVLKGKIFTSNTAGVAVEGTHECPTITDLLPTRSNPAGSEQILSGYQGIDLSGEIVEGVAKAGGGYEIVETAATTLNNGGAMTVYHTLGNISGFYSSPLDIGGYIGDGSSSFYNAIGLSMLNDTYAKCLYISGSGEYQLISDMIKNSYGDGSITFTSRFNSQIVKSTFVFVA